MRRWLILFMLLTVLSGCGRGVPIEDLAISLLLGIDLDEDDNLIISELSPVFNQEAKSNVETHQIVARSIRESRMFFDTMTTGKVTAAKIQVLLIGKRLIKQEGWFSVLDTIYRNPVFSINTKAIVVDGPVSDVIFYKPEDKPQLPLFLSRLIDENIMQTRSTMATLQIIHRHMYEKGMTPTITELKKDKDVIQIIGTALLDEKGKYVDTIDIQETALLLILRNKKSEELTLSMPLSSLQDQAGILHKNTLSIDILHADSNVKTKYERDRFHFSFDIYLEVTVIERILSDEIDDLSEQIKQELTSRFEELIRKIQHEKIDPIGHIHARAYEYNQYKKVEDRWGEALAEADIDLSLHVEVRSVGATK